MKEIDLYDTLLQIKEKNDLVAFFKDLCTPSELEALQERWRVCQILSKGTLSYREIHERTGASITTIGRVSRFLKDEPYKGYQTILEKIKNKKDL